MDEIEQNSENKEQRKTDDIIAWGESVISGSLTGHLAEYVEVEVSAGESSEEGFDVGDTVILDLDDQGVTENDRNKLIQWMEKHLGTPLGEAPIRATYLSPDETTTFRIFSKQLGLADDPWYLSEWQNEGQNPSYILWSREMYEEQEEFGYTKEDES